MAKKSKIARNRKREELVARYATRRAELKKVIKDPAVAYDQKVEARDALNALPRDSSATRLRHRDSINGRPRGFIGYAGLSRVTFRELAHRGELPGIRKASW